MTAIRPQLGPVVERIAALYDHEERLRSEGRRAELWPDSTEARRLFRRASAARRLRLALLRRWRLL